MNVTKWLELVSDDDDRVRVVAPRPPEATAAEVIGISNRSQMETIIRGA